MLPRGSWDCASPRCRRRYWRSTSRSSRKSNRVMAGEGTTMQAVASGQRRMFWLKVGLLAFFAVVAGRLVQIQVLDAARYREQARRQYEVRERLPAARGNLYDRNSRVLVSNAIGVSFGADRKMLGGEAGDAATRF